ncbi:contractile injection system protein, VgrG/Pvc8 family [Rhodovulum sp. YEN HP10]|uniref:contractile injection system protein, VgrG/Pvc8 family n=1 Tax=Rhodovulum sp. HP10 TaxID=3387397 RepID=UPI0039E167B7
MGRSPTVLGQDVLVLRRFEGTDHLNALFDCSADCLAAPTAVDFDRLIGTHATITPTAREGERPFDGIVTGARWLGSDDNGHRYRPRPRAFLASLRRNQLIFSNKTVVEILTELLSASAHAGAPRTNAARTTASRPREISRRSGRAARWCWRAIRCREPAARTRASARGIPTRPPIPA